MRRLARILGLLWMVGAIIGTILFLTGYTGGIGAGGRGTAMLIFLAILPGFLAYRWGRAGDGIV
jgi:hypothetical protein